jgi:hypothetical protein
VEAALAAEPSEHELTTEERAVLDVEFDLSVSEAARKISW